METHFSCQLLLHSCAEGVGVSDPKVVNSDVRLAFCLIAPSKKCGFFPFFIKCLEISKVEKLIVFGLTISSQGS